MNPLKIGLFGIGLDAYWPQFTGLKERLEGYLERVQRKLEQPGTVVVNLGLIDTPEKAFEAGHEFRRRMSTSSSCTSPRTRCRRQCCRSCGGPRFR